MIEISIRNNRDSVMTLEQLLNVSEDLLVPFKIDGEKYFQPSELSVSLDEVIEMQAGLAGRSGTGISLEYDTEEHNYNVVVFEFAGLTDYEMAIKYASDLYRYLKSGFIFIDGYKKSLKELENTDPRDFVVADMTMATDMEDYIVIEGLRHNIILHSDTIGNYFNMEDPEREYTDFIIRHQMVNAMPPGIFANPMKSAEGVRHVDIMVPVGVRTIIPSGIEMLGLLDDEFSDMKENFSSLLTDLNPETLNDHEEFMRILDERINETFQNLDAMNENRKAADTEYTVHIFDPMEFTMEENEISKEQEDINILKFTERVKASEKVSFRNFIKNLLKKNYSVLDDGQIIVENFSREDADRIIKKSGKVKEPKLHHDEEKGKILSFTRKKKSPKQ